METICHCMVSKCKLLAKKLSLKRVRSCQIPIYQPYFLSHFKLCFSAASSTWYDLARTDSCLHYSVNNLNPTPTTSF